MKNLNELDGCPASKSPPGAERNESKADTCIALYLRDIGRARLLTRQEEVELAARIRNGDRDAREQMITSNLRLVIKIARAYEGIGLPLVDLISEGNIGLMKAVDRFDPHKGAKLSSWSAFWIRQAITQALASQAKTIRLPTHVVDQVAKLSRAASRLHEELGREPTDDELAAEVGTTPRRVTRMRVAAIRPASLDEQIDAEDTRSYAETIADENAELPHEKLEEKERTAMLHEVAQMLNEREQAILRLRFGFDGEPPKSFNEIGEELGVSSERVRQLQNAALKKVHRRIKSLEKSLTAPFSKEAAASEKKLRGNGMTRLGSGRLRPAAPPWGI